MANSAVSCSERGRLEQGVYDACLKSAEGADLLISAFVAALLSYRRASVCAPFPGFLINNAKNKDFEAAKELVAHFPPAQAVASSKQPSSEGVLNPVEEIPLQALMLLYWILRFRYQVQLVQDLDELSDLGLSNSPGNLSKLDLPLDRSMQPSNVLKIQELDEQSEVNKVFQSTKAQHGSIIAFHGTTTESLHSILRCGLLNMSRTHLQRNGAIFGDGVYLSTDLWVAASFSKSGDTWTRSCLGSRVRYVLVCEVAKGKGVVCSTRDLQGTSDGRKDLAGESATEGHGTYVVVENSELIRIRYVLVYSDCSRGLGKGWTDAEANVPSTKRIPWMATISGKVRRLDWFSFIILLYVLLLLFVGFSKNGVKGTRFRTSIMVKQLWWLVDRVRGCLGIHRNSQ